MSAYVDLKVTVLLLTRTCECGCSGEFQYVPAHQAGCGIDTWRQAEQARDKWWSSHQENCGKARAA